MSEWVEATVVERIRWNDALISLRFEAELAPFNAGQFRASSFARGWT